MAVFQHFACCDDLTSIPEVLRTYRIHTYICKYTYTYIHMQIHTCTYTYTFIHTYVHMHIHIHTYIHTYISASSQGGGGGSGPEVALTYHGLSQCVHELQIVPALLNEPAVFRLGRLVTCHLRTVKYHTHTVPTYLPTCISEYRISMGSVSVCLCFFSLFEEVVGRSEGSILSGDHLFLLGHIRGGRNQGQPDPDPEDGDPDPDPLALAFDGRSDLTLDSDGANLSINTFVLLLVAIAMQVRVA